MAIRMTELPARGRWETLRPEEGASRFASVSVPWWVAGGWALDLFLGKQTREHGDLDFGVLRSDATQLIAALPDWEIFEARNGVLHKLLPEMAPRPEVNSLWCRPAGNTSWVLEILLDSGEGGSWIFRRHPEIRRPLSEVILRSSGGIPYLAPEIQLLYKAQTPRAKDQDDFSRVAPQLDSTARRWLRNSLRTLQSTHPWLASLEDR